MPIDKDHISTLMKLRESLFRARENLEEQINDDFYSGWSMARSISSIDGVASSLKILFPEQTKDIKLNAFVLEDDQGNPVYDSDLMIELSIAHYDKVLEMVTTIAERLGSEDLPDLIDDQLLNSLLES